MHETLERSRYTNYEKHRLQAWLSQFSHTRMRIFLPETDSEAVVRRLTVREGVS
jgi:hypothetical protein